MQPIFHIPALKQSQVLFHFIGNNDEQVSCCIAGPKTEDNTNKSYCSLDTKKKGTKNFSSPLESCNADETCCSNRSDVPPRHSLAHIVCNVHVHGTTPSAIIKGSCPTPAVYRRSAYKRSIQLKRVIPLHHLQMQRMYRSLSVALHRL